MNFNIDFWSINELGQRSGQEDCIYPAIGAGNPDNGLFIVCDGMGGHDKGEVASQAVCKAISDYIDAHQSSDGSFNETDFNNALSYAYDALDVLDDGAVKKMGTTMTFLKFHNSGCLIAHIGDSRIYHIRPSAPRGKRILHVTRDHSLVNDLVAIGELTPEEAKTSRQKNIITRAMQPCQERRSRADVRQLTDVRPGDIFYMCTDGMLEQAEDIEIEDLLSDETLSEEQKVAKLIEQTQNNRDNHSAQIVRVKGQVGRKSNNVIWALLGVMLALSAVCFYIASIYK